MTGPYFKILTSQSPTVRKILYEESITRLLTNPAIAFEGGPTWPDISHAFV